MTDKPPKSFPYRSRPAAYATKKQLIAVNLRIDRANDKIRDIKVQLENLISEKMLSGSSNDGDSK